MRSMIQQNPGVALRPGSVHEFGDSRIVAREISARGDALRGVLLWVSDTGQEYFAGQTLFAERGTLQPLAPGTARLVLYDGVILLSPQEGGGETRFQTFETVIRKRTPLSPGTRSRSPVSRFLLSLTASEKQRRQERAHKPATPKLNCIDVSLRQQQVSSLASWPSRSPVWDSASHARQAASSVWFSPLGIMVSPQLGDGLAQAGVLPIGLGVWLPNILVGVLAGLLLWLQDRPWMRWRAPARQPAQGPPQAAPPADPRTRRALLPRYVLHHYVLMLFLTFGFLLVGYLLVDILERLEWFARHNATLSEALRFYSARIPLLASRIIPMALLLATALTVSVLSFHRELIGMRACGISATRQLSCILLVASLIAPLSFVLNESIVPRSNALADRLKETEIKDRSGPHRRAPEDSLVPSRQPRFSSNTARPGPGRSLTAFDLRTWGNGLTPQPH